MDNCCWSILVIWRQNNLKIKSELLFIFYFLKILRHIPQYVMSSLSFLINVKFDWHQCTDVVTVFFFLFPISFFKRFEFLYTWKTNQSCPLNEQVSFQLLHIFKYVYSNLNFVSLTAFCAKCFPATQMFKFSLRFLI